MKGLNNMECYALNYKGNKKTIKKDLSQHDTLNYNYVNSTDLQSPVIRITYSDELDLQMLKYNYIVLNPSSAVKDFGKRKRCYFVDMSRTRNVAKGIWEVGLTLDVLTTYQSEILSSTANIERSASNYNLYLNDNFYNAFAYPRIGCRIFPSGFSDEYNYLLTVCNTLGYEEGGATSGS